MSNANKLLIRCAWAGNSAFASAGYGSSWGPGTCPSPPGWYVSETAGLTCTQVCGNANLACDAATMLENNDEIDTAAELVSLVSTLTGGNRCTRGANGNYGSNIDVPNIKTSGHCHFSSPERTLESVDCDGKHSPSFRLCWCSLSPPSPPHRPTAVPP